MSNAGVYDKLAILDEYLVNQCWMFTRERHLDDRLSLSQVSRRRSHEGAINSIHWWMARPRMSEQLYMTQVFDATSKTYCPIKTFCPPPVWRPLKISPTKVEKPTSGTELYRHANFLADRREISVPGQKIHIFLIRDFPGVLLSHATHFWKALVKLMLRPIWLAIFEIFAVEIWDFGVPWGCLPKSGDFVSGTDMYHRAKFHADQCHRRRDICNRTHRNKHRKIQRITAELISDNQASKQAVSLIKICQTQIMTTAWIYTKMEMSLVNKPANRIILAWRFSITSGRWL